MAVFTPTAARPLRRGSTQSLLLAITAAAAIPTVLAIAAALVTMDVAPRAPAQPAPIPSATDDATPSPRESATPRHTPTATPTPTPSARPTVEPTPVATVLPTAAPTQAPVTPAPTPPPPSPAPDYSRPGGIYLDILTAYRGYGEWYRSLLDTIYMLPADYSPGDLVDTAAAGLNSGYAVRAFVVADLAAMVDAARANGTPLAVVSGFRSYAQQQSTFDYWVGVGGYEQALRTSARPGHSEHQLGTSLDFTTAGGIAPWEYPDWAATPAGGWMAANAWRYGFVMSYPAGSFAITGYDYEPWHYRYVGRDVAAAVHHSGLPLRQYLWQAR